MINLKNVVLASSTSISSKKDIRKVLALDFLDNFNRSMRLMKKSIWKEKSQLKFDWRKQVEIMLNFILGLAVTYDDSFCYRADPRK